MSYHPNKIMDYKQNDVAIKSVKDRVIHGMGIRFGSPDDTDLDGEFFTAETETGLINGANRPMLMEHGWSKSFGVNKVADAIFEKSDTGWEYTATFLDNALGNQAYNEIVNKAYRSSSGAAGHTRRSTIIKGKSQIDTWLVAEQSATQTPADPQNARITRTKSDFMLMAIREMFDEFQTTSDARVKQVFEAFETDANAKREALATALAAFKESFSEGDKIAITSEFITNLDEAIEQVVKPIAIIGL